MFELRKVLALLTSLALSLTLLPIPTNAAPVNLSYSSSNFTLVSDATVSGAAGSEVIQLTPNLGGQKGAVFSNSRILVTESFSVSSQIYLGTNDAGADGLAFVLQPNSTTSLSSGGGLGYDGVTNAFAVEFDTYFNVGNEEGAADHVALMKSSATSHDDWITTGVNSSSIFEFSQNIEDSTWRKFQFDWVPSAAATSCTGGEGSVTVKYDIDADGTFEVGETIYDGVCIDLEGYFKSYNYATYFGFTAATGGATNQQQVKALTSSVSIRSNSSPIISPLSDISYLAGVGLQTRAVTLSDDGTTSAQWSVSVSSNATGVATVSSAGSYPSVSGGSSGTFNLRITPVAAGTATITITATDADGASATRTFDVTVQNYDIAPFANSVSGVVGTALSVSAYTKSGFTPDPTFSISPALPAGLTLNTTTGAITGTPTESLATTTFTVTAANTADPVQSATATVTLTISSATRTITPNKQVISAVTDSAITASSSLTANNFATAPTYSISPALPTGLSLNTSTGVISGTPVVALTPDTYTITGSNANGESATATVVINGYKIIYDSHGGSDIPYDAFLSGDSVTLADAPTRSNYRFNGWFTEENGGTEVTSPYSPANANITLHAQWTYAPPRREPRPNPTVTPPVTDPATTPVTPKEGGPEPVPPTEPIATPTAVVTVNGVPKSVEYIANESKTAVVLRADDWQLQVSVTKENGDAAPLSQSNQVLVEKGNLVSVSGEGFAPFTDVNVYAFSTPKFLGIIKTDANGNFSGQLSLGTDFAEGLHTLQVNGYSKENLIRSASLGMVVVAAPKLTRLPLVISFKSNSAKLSSKAKKMLKNLILEPGTQLLVQGYASLGNPTSDLKLSRARAESARKFLAKSNSSLKLEIRGLSSRISPLCQEFKNRCVIINQKS